MTSSKTTGIRVEVRAGRHQVGIRAGLLRAQRLHGPPDRARVALVGQTALLLGGDEVELALEVGAGAQLELSDVAATVAYHGRGRPAGWRVSVQIGPGGSLRYAGEPLVVCDGADVIRTLDLDLAEDASARLRETVVFGRAGERGGRLDSTQVLRRGGQEFSRERWTMEPSTRERPGVLAGIRVIDSVFELGLGHREGACAPDTPVPSASGSFSERLDVTTYELLDQGSTLTRFLGVSTADSPLR